MAAVLPPEVAALLAQAGGAASRRELVAIGATDNDLRRWVRRGLLQRVRDGVYALAGDLGIPGMDANHQRQLAAAMQAGPDVVVSHRSAALLHGLPLANGVGRPEVTRDESGPRITGLRVHRYGVSPAHVMQKNGLRVTTAARTVVDVCRVVPLVPALVTSDAALRQQLVTAAECREALLSLGDINFRRRTYQVIGLSDPGAESPFESISRGHLLEEGVPRPLLQWWVGDGENIWFRPDMLWWEWGLIGEADGRVKYQDPDALWKEKLRQDWLESQGLAVVRWISPEMRRSPESVARRWGSARDRQVRLGWTCPAGLWLAPPGPWPPSRPSLQNCA